MNPDTRGSAAPSFGQAGTVSFADIDQMSASCLMSYLRAARVAGTETAVEKAELRMLLAGVLPAPNLINDLLPPEVLSIVFALLSPRDLTSASLVCHMWNELTMDETIWQTVARRMLADKQFAHLSSARVEVVRAFWDNSFRRFLHHTLTKPPMLDRNVLVDACWQFRFRSILRGYPHAGSSSAVAMGSRMRWCTFTASGVLRMCDDAGELTVSYPYRFMPPEAVDGECAIRVADFPPLIAKRDPVTWAWTLSNRYAKFVSYDPELTGSKQSILAAEAEKARAAAADEGSAAPATMPTPMES